jgi:hypothetical protein
VSARLTVKDPLDQRGKLQVATLRVEMPEEVRAVPAATDAGHSIARLIAGKSNHVLI